MEIKELYYEIKKNFLAKDEHQNFRLVDKTRAFELLFRSFAKEDLSNSHINQLIELIKFEKESDRNFLAQRLASFLIEFLKMDFMMILEEDEFLSISPVKQTINTFTAYWTILSYCNTKGLNFLPSYTQENYLDKFSLLVKKAKPYRLNLAFQNLRQANFTYFELEGTNFTNCNLSGASLLYSSFTKCNFQNVSFDRANLTEANLTDSNLSFTSLREAVLLKTVLHKCSIHSCDFQLAELSQAILSEAQLKQSSFHGITANYISLKSAIIDKCHFTNAALYKADFSGSQLKDCKITGSDFHASIWESVKISSIQIDAKSFERAVFKDTYLDEVNLRVLQRLGAVIKKRDL